jgi:hypothetical protein
MHDLEQGIDMKMYMGVYTFVFPSPTISLVVVVPCDVKVEDADIHAALFITSALRRRLPLLAGQPSMQIIEEVSRARYVRDKP